MNNELTVGVGTTINDKVAIGEVYTKQNVFDKPIGQKFDQDKLQMARFYKQFPNAIKGIMRAGSYGMKKYSEGNGNTNWKEVPDALTRYQDALMRHLDSYLTGEKIDPESGLDTLDHLIWCVSAIIELEHQLK